MAFTSYTDELARYRDILNGLSAASTYSVNGRTYTQADMATVRETIDWLEAKVAAGTAGGATRNFAGFARPQ